MCGVDGLARQESKLSLGSIESVLWGKQLNTQAWSVRGLSTLVRVGFGGQCFIPVCWGIF